MPLSASRTASYLFVPTRGVVVTDRTLSPSPCPNRIESNESRGPSHFACSTSSHVISCHLETGESQRCASSVVGSSTSSPARSDNGASGDAENSLPVLLRRTVDRVEELDNGEV